MKPSSLRRFQDHKPPLVRILALHDGHPAVVEGETFFPARRVWPGLTDRLLKSGHHSRKIGKQVMKGKWAGMPIYTLTLEERATCPSSCRHWRDCYGNKMNWSERIMHGPDFEWRLYREIAALAGQYSQGFVVRLHVLGDFYSEGYVLLWAAMLSTFPELRCFGYTARQPDSQIGKLIASIREAYHGRFAIRFSNADVPVWGATTIYRAPEAPVVLEGIVCPAQTDRTACCATCALCWATEKNIVFIAH